MSNHKKHTRKKASGKGASIVRQVVGAAVGGSLALGLYYAYEYGAPVVTAWLTVPQGQYSVSGTGTAAHKNLKEEEAKRIAQRAQYVVDKYGQKEDLPAPKKAVPSNWDLDAIDNLEVAADEGWGDFADEWPEPPEAPVDEAPADEWEAAWDDAWDDEFDSLEALETVAYAEDGAEAGNPDDWESTWDNSFWEERLSGETAATGDAPVRSLAKAEVKQEPAVETEVKASVASHAPALPSSGLELWVAGFITVCGTVALRRRRVMQLLQGAGVC